MSINVLSFFWLVNTAYPKQGQDKLNCCLWLYAKWCENNLRVCPNVPYYEKNLNMNVKQPEKSKQFQTQICILSVHGEAAIIGIRECIHINSSGVEAMVNINVLQFLWPTNTTYPKWGQTQTELLSMIICKTLWLPDVLTPGKPMRIYSTLIITTCPWTTKRHTLYMYIWYCVYIHIIEVLLWYLKW